MQPVLSSVEIEDRLEALADRLSGSADSETALISMLLADMRQRRLLEEQLAHSRQLFELAHEAAGVCAYTFYIPEDKLEWSQSTSALYGLQPESKPTIETWLAAIHPDDREQAARVARAAIEHGDSIDHGFRIVLPGGRIRHVRDRGRVLRDETGCPTTVVGLNIDVTELVEARETADRAQQIEALTGLLQNQKIRSAELQTFIDALPTGLMITNATRSISYINKALSEIWRGRHELNSVEDWNGYEAWSVGTGALLSDSDWPLARAVQSGSPQAVEEIRFKRFDGSIGYMLVSATPLLDASGDVVAALAVTQDISTWREAEEQSQLEISLLRKLGDVTPDYLFLKDRAGRLLYANAAVINSTGRPWTELKGKTEAEWHHDPNEAESIRINDQRIMASGTSETVEETYTSVSGLAVVRATKTPILDDRGNVIGLVGVGVDVTREHEANAHLQLLVNELNHRVKNTLAIVQSMARSAFYRIDAARTAYDGFEQRLIALSGAHDLLSESQWVGVSVRDVIRRTCKPHAADQFDYEGEDIALGSREALAVSMAIHELCTNATKYGALKSNGRVRVRWTVEGDEFSLHWTEHGGPPVSPPTKSGFGSAMLRQAIGALSAGRVSTTFEPEGAECSLAFRLN